MRANTLSRHINKYGAKPQCKACGREIDIDDQYVSTPGSSGSRTYRCKECEEKRVD